MRLDQFSLLQDNIIILPSTAQMYKQLVVDGGGPLLVGAPGPGPLGPPLNPALPLITAKGSTVACYVPQAHK